MRVKVLFRIIRLASKPFRGSIPGSSNFPQQSLVLNRHEGTSFSGRFQEISIETSFTALGLAPELVRSVTEQGYTQPTPIQLQAIPLVLAGRDLLGAAQTGTGKTAGFALPILQILSTRTREAASPKHPVRALILTPTRELAAQVQESVRTYGAHVRVRSTVIFGGVNINPQIAELRRGVDILVATPGRLLDHVQQKTLDLSRIEILVLDEADRMLDMGFLPDIRRILALLPARRQNLLFSATFSDEIRKLAGSFLHDPATVEVARRNTPVELIGQVVHPVDKDRKRELLAHLVKSHSWYQVLVFTKTKHGANRLAQQLVKDGIEADAIHGNKSQPARTRALKRFKDGALQVLVATDIAARGLDIEALPHVVNYDLPNVSEDYIHRIGRTGRAGASGEAISLVCAEDRPLLAAIEKLTNRKIEQRIVEGFEPGRGGPRPAAEPEAPRPPRQTRPAGSAGDRAQPRHARGGQGQPHSGRSPGQGDPRPARSAHQPPRDSDTRPRPQAGRGGPQADRGASPRGPQRRFQQGPLAGAGRSLDRLEAERLEQLREGRRLARSEANEQGDEQAAAPQPAPSRGFPTLFGFLKRKTA